MSNEIAKYLIEIQADLSTGRAREHTYRSALQKLIESVDNNVRVQNEPSRSEHGSPDFIIFPKSNANIISCYAETKDLGIDLDRVEKSDQLRRYFGYPSLILTNYLEFRFFRNGERYGDPVVIATLTESTLSNQPDNFSIFVDTLAEFLQGKPQPIKSGKRLAEIMGGMARRIRDNVQHYLASKTEADLALVYETVKKLLVHDLKPEAFADMYSQTLVYGLFVARFHDESPETFNRQEARDLIPPSNPFLRRFFDHIAGPDFDKRLSYIVNELCEVLRISDVQALMHQYFEIDLFSNKQIGPDPVIHFYEDFLQEYDSELRKRMGAYYTPLPVVDFIVRSVDYLLEKEFGLAAGLADTTKIGEIHKVQILDPAVGTGTFLNETIKAIYARFENQKGRWPAYVHYDLLPRLHGFELMMAPYTIAHLKLSMTLRDTGFYYFNKTRDGVARLGIYLTNSLEDTISKGELFSTLGLEGSIAEEAKEASKIKNEKPIMVVIGNPPYSGESSNASYKGNDVYKVEPGGGKLRERNPKWLNDDYVKFIRLAEHFIEKNKGGVVAMITAHGYIDNPTFRGMRWHLASTFDDIYVLDLHGNANKKEVAPDGSADENIFNIKQGVAIFVGMKKDGEKNKRPAAIHRADILGDRKHKFTILAENDVNTTKWQHIEPIAPNYEWVARNETVRKTYNDGFSVAEIFEKSGVGVVTARDHYVISDSSDELVRNAIKFRDSQAKTQADLCAEVGISNKKGWDAIKARESLRLEHNPEDCIREIAYRPFDIKKIFYHPSLVWRSVDVIMRHFLAGNNIGLVTTRQVKAGDSFQHILIANRMVESTFISNKTGEIGYVFPLYSYSGGGAKSPNLNKEVVTNIEKVVGGVSPEEVMDYIYAMLYSPTYREKFREFLRIDFPRVPYPKSKESFKKLATLGTELRLLHFLESPRVDKFITTYSVGGSNVVEKVDYRGGKAFINADQHFGDVPEVAWNFYVGGYQPAQKWLKDRKGRSLINDEIEHYQKIIVALVETDRIMKKIDEVGLS